LKRYFGINKLLDGDNAREIFDACSEMLQMEEFSVRGLLDKMNVELVCTTESPLDMLGHHRIIKDAGLGIKVCVAFRPDKAFATEDLAALNTFIDRLGQLCGKEIRDFDAYLEALHARHGYFHANGCRLSDYGLTPSHIRVKKSERYSRK
jgi:glucuronate isomerase